MVDLIRICLRSFAGLPVFAALLFAAWESRTAADDEPVNLAAGTSFRSALEQPFAPTWDHIDLRGIARTVEEGPRVAIVIDRRIDPTVERSLTASSDTLRECLDRLAAECDAGATVVGHAVYLGPRETAARLRTLAALRKADLKELHVPESRRTALNRARLVRWHDLDRPADIVRRLAEDNRLEVEGLELIPHDLWAAGALPEATPAEALTLVLAQFDLTFHWTSEGQGISLEPIPERVTIDRPHDPPRGVSPADAIARWKVEIPDLEARAAAGKVLVSGTEERHELVERVRRGERAADKAPRSTAAQIPPLDKKLYHGKIKNIPVSALLRNLETPGQGLITFEYDRAEFKAAGIDLEQPVSFELKNDKIEDLLKKALGPLGVEFEIHDRTVRLTPSKKP